MVVDVALDGDDALTRLGSSRYDVVCWTGIFPAPTGE